MTDFDATKNSAEPRLTPWQIETRRRWTRLQGLIAETEYDLFRASSVDDRKTLEAAIRTLKRAALSVWVDARRVGMTLPGAPSNQTSALVEG